MLVAQNTVDSRFLDQERKRIQRRHCSMQLKKHGAEAVDDPEGHGKRRGKAPAFQGAGFKLGSDVEPSQQIGVPMSSAPKPQDQNVAIIFWKNGFTVWRDGPLRDFDDPANKEFLGS